MAEYFRATLNFDPFGPFSFNKILQLKCPPLKADDQLTCIFKTVHFDTLIGKFPGREPDQLLKNSSNRLFKIFSISGWVSQKSIHSWSENWKFEKNIWMSFSVSACKGFSFTYVHCSLHWNTKNIKYRNFHFGWMLSNSFVRIFK